MTNAPHELTFEQTVPRRLVHRAALGEVYVTDSAQRGPDEFVVAVQIPRAHCVWFDRLAPYHDPLATAEAARQGVYVVVHRYVGIEQGKLFSLQGLRFCVADLEAYRDHGVAPLEGILTLRREDVEGQRQLVGGMTFSGELAIDGVVAMRMRGDLLVFPRDDYEALREFQREGQARDEREHPAAGPPLDAEAVGRLDRRNSLLGQPTSATGAEGKLRFPLIVDTQHPAFFDHAYDHVPGPLIVEAYRQAALYAAHRHGALSSPVAALTACEATFTDFAELDARVEVEAELAERNGLTVAVALRQFGKTISAGCVELQPYPGVS